MSLSNALQLGSYVLFVGALTQYALKRPARGHVCMAALAAVNAVAQAIEGDTTMTVINILSFAVFVVVWWTGGGGDNTRRRLRRTAPAGDAT